MDAFNHRLAASAQRAGSWLCVGLDPDPANYPDDLQASDTQDYLAGIIAATSEFACAYKPNAAFFEALGPEGYNILADTIASIPNEIPVILDGKRNDIGHTAEKYAEAAFEEMGADAITVTPYLGTDTIAPFSEYHDRGVFVLCRTSNNSAPELQDLTIDPKGTKLWEVVATKAMQDWNGNKNVGLVAGATYPDELTQIRKICGDGIPLLIPGVGAQGADASATLAAGADSKGEFAVVNVGRSIMYASKQDDWAQAAQRAAEKFSAKLAPRN